MYERAFVRRATIERDGAGVCRRGASRHHPLCEPRRTDRRRDPRADARQCRLRAVLRPVRGRRGCACPDWPAKCPARVDTLARPHARPGIDPVRAGAPAARLACRHRRVRCMRASHTQRGFVAAVLHRLSGIALAIFLPLHFLALATALNGANALDSFLAVTRNPLVEAAEFGLVAALALHMTLGLRVLAIEFLDLREKTAAIVSLCAAAACAAGLVF